MAKRNCRRTASEHGIHERAVRLRKMTDSQLCDFIDEQIALSESNGYHKGSKDGYSQRREEEKSVVASFLSKLKEEKGSGIGAVTFKKLMEKANEYGYC